MPEWLMSDAWDGSAPSAVTMLFRLCLALGLGLAVSGFYRLSHGRGHGNPAALSTTLVLLSVLIAMVSMTIGNSVARAFSLVGALSIVRFRTVVDDTRDTAFVIFSVIVGMAAGAGLLWLPVIGLPIVGLASIGMDRWGQRSHNHAALRCRLTVRLALGRPPGELDTCLLQWLDDLRLIEIETARQGIALDLTYLGRLREKSAAVALVTGLNQFEGVISVDLRQDL